MTDLETLQYFFVMIGAGIITAVVWILVYISVTRQR